MSQVPSQNTNAKGPTQMRADAKGRQEFKPEGGSKLRGHYQEAKLLLPSYCCQGVIAKGPGQRQGSGVRQGASS